MLRHRRPVRRRTTIRPTLEAMEDRTLLSLFTVTNGNDSGDGSLRAAIALADANPGADEIDFAQGIGQVVLTSGQLSLSGEVTVRGPSSGVTIQRIRSDTLQGFRIFDVAVGATSTLENLTINGGWDDDGGGLLNRGTLTVRACTVHNNWAGFGSGGGLGGGIYNQGTLFLTSSTISDNEAGIGTNGFGGGIHNEGSLTIEASTISGNKADMGSGGGINNEDGRVTILSSTITGNSATVGGGGISNIGGTLSVTSSRIDGNGSVEDGGIMNDEAGNVTISASTLDTNFGVGISNKGTVLITLSTIRWNYGGGIDNDGTVTVTFSTISNNSGAGLSNQGAVSITSSTFSGNRGGHGGAIDNFGGTVAVTSSTISGNSAAIDGGGISNTNGGLMTVTSSTVVGNSAEIGSGIRNFAGTLRLNNSIVAINSVGLDVSGDFEGTNNLIGTDPRLGPLQDNGGPTWTHAPLPGSSAIDAGDNSLAVDPDGNPLADDQRGPGFPRIVGGKVDIGAVETAYEIPSLIVTTPLDVVDASDNLTSLREAVAYAAQKPGADMITFDPTVAAVILTGGQIGLEGEVSIVGPATGVIVVRDASAPEFRILDVAEGAIVTIQNLTISGGVADRDGGGIRNAGTLSIASCSIGGNHADDGSGGGISSNGTLTVFSSTIGSNSGFFGGGIAVTSGIATIESSTIDGNSAWNIGGGITSNGALTIASSTISGNTVAADGFGGGISNGGELTLTTSTIRGNSAAYGGGILNGGTASVSSSILSLNSAGSDGGGIENFGTVTIANCTLSGNSAAGNGGGIENEGNLSVISSTFSENTAGQFGGGIRNADVGELEITTSTFSGNSAESLGGGILNEGTATINAGTLSGNKAGESGGGAANDGNMTILDSILQGNSAFAGGGVDNKRTLVVERSTLVGNSATLLGGGIVNSGNDGVLSIASSTLAGNSAGDSGGGICGDGKTTVTSSTISGNSAGGNGGGIYNVNLTGTLTVTSCTMYGNSAAGDGGGIYNLNAAVVTNSIVAGSPSGGDLHGGFTGSSNLVQDGSGLGLTGTLIGDPRLGPLQDNGGPTWTHAPLPGSPAIDAGENLLAVDPDGSPLTFDQRGAGFDRIRDGTVDIGAFEVQELPPATIDALRVNPSETAYPDQRSSVRELAVDVHGTVAVAPSGAFTITRGQDGATFGVVVNSIAPLGGGITRITLSFVGLGLEYGSLPDGDYLLAIDGGQVLDEQGLALDADGDGSPGGTNAALAFHRFFGDTDGDRDVDGADLALFRKASLELIPFLDFLDFNRGGPASPTSPYDDADRAAFLARYGRRLRRPS